MKCKECEYCYSDETTQFRVSNSDRAFCLNMDLYTHVDPEKECAENCDNDKWVIEHSYKKEVCGMETKKLAMISQPMNRLTDEEILSVREKAKKILEEKGYEVVDTFFKDYNSDAKHKAVDYLSKAIKAMSKVDVVYFCKGWENARGCVIENKIAIDYEIDVIEDYTK